MRAQLLADQPTLVGRSVRLEPMGPEHAEGLRPLFVGDAAESMADLLVETARVGLSRARTRSDRADWAIVRQDDGTVVGEVVLFELDEEHAAMTFRIALVGPEVFGRGYGSESTCLVRDFAFGPLGLHRLSLDVAEENQRAVRVYEKAGFRHEGRRRQVRKVDGQWRDQLLMAILDSDLRHDPKR